MIANPVASKLLTFGEESNGDNREKEKENKTQAIIVTGKYKILTDRKNLTHFLSGVKRPNTKKDGDWVCLQCKNLNFAYRTICNICKDSKNEYITI